MQFRAANSANLLSLRHPDRIGTSTAPISIGDTYVFCKRSILKILTLFIHSHLHHLGLILLTLSTMGFGKDAWTSFRGNPELTGVADGKLPQDLELLWTFETGDGIESTAAIHGGTVYVGSLDGFLYAIKLRDGTLKWRYRASDPIKSSPTVYKRVVYLGDEMGVFHAVNARTGRQKWTFQTDESIISSANHASNRVIFGSYDQYLYCLSAKDGSLIWKFETDGYVHGSPTIVANHVAVAGCDGYLRLIQVDDGLEKSKIDLGDYVAASIAVSRPYAYVGTFGNELLCIDLKNAKIVWRYENSKRQFPFYASAAVTDDFVIVGGRDRMIHAVSPLTGESYWSYAVRSPVDSSPVIVGERVFFGTTGGILYGLKVKSGELDWQFVIGSPIVASPSAASGKLVIGSAEGVLYCFGER